MDGNSGPISTSDIEPGDNHRADVESDIDSMIRNRKLVVQVTFRSKKIRTFFELCPRDPGPITTMNFCMVEMTAVLFAIRPSPAIGIPPAFSLCDKRDHRDE